MPSFPLGLTALVFLAVAMAAEPARALPGFAAPEQVNTGSIVRVQAYYDDDEDDDDRGYRTYRPAYGPPPYAYGYAPPGPYAPNYYAAPRVIVQPPAVVIAPPPAVVVAPPAAYYGWTPAGGCGTYRYWNGDRCVDARRKYDYRW